MGKKFEALAAIYAQEPITSDFLEMYGSSIPINQMSGITGIPAEILEEVARIMEFTFPKEPIRPRGYEHLPGLPSNTVVHKWHLGTKYYTPVTNQPGYVALTVHCPAFPLEDQKLKNDD